MSLSSDDQRKRLQSFQDLFVEARDCIADAEESIGTTYYDEDFEAAKEAVDEAVQAYEDIISELDTKEASDVRSANGLKVEQLKGELSQVVDKSMDDH